MMTDTPLTDELFRRRRRLLAQFKCVTCPLSSGCSEECLLADLLCEIAELRAEVERLKAPAPRVRPPRPRRNSDRDGAIIADHQAGCTITTLAKRHGITPGRVATILREVYAR